MSNQTEQNSEEKAAAAEEPGVVDAGTNGTAANETEQKKPQAKAAVPKAPAKAPAPPVVEETPALPQKSAKERYEELPYSATVVYECDGPDTKTQEGESEITSRKLTPSCTKGHWEGLPRWDKGIRKGQPMHLANARLIGFMEDGELVKL